MYLKSSDDTHFSNGFNSLSIFNSSCTISKEHGIFANQIQITNSYLTTDEMILSC